MTVLIIGSDRLNEMTIALDAVQVGYKAVKYNGITKALFFCFELYKTIYRGKFDIVLVDTYSIAGLCAYIVSLFFRIPLCIRLRGDVLYELRSRSIMYLKKGNLILFILTYCIDRRIVNLNSV